MVSQHVPTIKGLLAHLTDQVKITNAPLAMSLEAAAIDIRVATVSTGQHSTTAHRGHMHTWKQSAKHPCATF
jgi:hypothetical protein